jgi:flagellar biosynthesis protein FlhF
MRIKKYVAKSMREALLEIKKDLGESAVILKTRKMNATSFPFGGKDIEVTAAVEEDSASLSVPRSAFPEIALAKGNGGVYRKPRTSCVVENAELVELRPWKPPVMSSVAKKQPAGEKKTENPDVCYSELKEDLKQLTTMVTSALKKGSASTEGGFSGGWSVLFKKLIDSEVRPEIASGLITSLQNGIGQSSGPSDAVPAAVGSTEEKMLGLLRAQFPIAGPIKCKNKGPVIIAFTGPTGSGKTTTLAKLVAHCCLNKNKKVSIITADTYRIAAIEQIRMFADIVKAELQVVFSPEEVGPALVACAKDDIVFVDTAGRSPHNTEHMEELKRYLAALHPDEVHLVVSSTTKDSDLRDTVDRYREVGADRLLFTKLDETRTVGNIFNTVNTSAMPVSFFTFGQSVPDDIELAQPARFVQRLWEGNAA